MRYVLIFLSVMFFSMTPTLAQVSVGISLPGISIGINVPLYPELVPVPGYPVYYAPRLNANFFFYDGMYWVYQGNNWYSSSWYNGPWWSVNPEYVPLFVLRVPVRYYHAPPRHFRGWKKNEPPRWSDHWGHNWQQRRSGWDRWDRHAAPRPAPLPDYQRNYARDRYPREAQQRELNARNYRYQPRDPEVRQYYREQAVPRDRSGYQQRLQGKEYNRNSGQRDDAPQRQQQYRQEPQRQDSQQQRSPEPQRQDYKQQENRNPQQSPGKAPTQRREPAAQDQRQQAPQGAPQRDPRSSQNVDRNSDKDYRQDKSKNRDEEKDRKHSDQ